ncbi:protein kinase [Nocardia sp. NPDC057663]|uniref:protein kinase domain-containing protein n=1 Tax=Nocardia sp. NPDC057663 TaxID=3346201 RepID=UPI0036724AAD
MQPLGSDDPRQIGAYRLLGVLGAGGMGKVYLGRNAGGRTVAVKVIRPDLLGDPEFRVRFRREVAAARRVGGAFTAPVLDADVDADPPWLATGYVAGLALSDAVARFGPFAEPSLLALGHGLAEALVAIHGAGVVHRDLKPSNVLLAVDGPKVVDFGIARAVEDTALTTTGKVIGSPGFMCPEQVTGEPLGPACDVFALGGVLTFAASGHGPFGTAEIVQMLWRIVYEEPRLAGLPPSLRPLVAACVAKDAAARPTPQEVLSELAGIGRPERSGWLPPAVLEEVSMRAVRLLDLDSGPADFSAGLGTPDTSIPDRAATGWHAGAVLPAATGGYYTASPGVALPAATTGGHTPPPGAPLPAANVGGYTPVPYSTVRRPVGGAGDPTMTPTAWHLATRPDAVSGPHPILPERSASRRTRNLLAVAAVTVAAAVAAGAFLIGIQLRDQPDAGGVADTTSVAEATDTPTATGAPATTVPSAFVGSWQGQASDGPVRFAIELTIGNGKVGQKVATASNTGTISGERCERSETLVEATTDRLVFRAKLTGKSARGCVDEGATSTVTLRPDGTLAYSTPGVLGGSIAGVLRKS